ncbi:MAG: hypothetical protein EOP84_32685 [Verrucomicrobiaceae bacterium]|nr:MAG: hypothetical protein EOP84_32685 [Verrucomicrobiaceae bacterium]
MLHTLRFSEIGEADLYTHFLHPCGRLERVVKTELKHGHVGIVGNLNHKQLDTINRLRWQMRKDNPRLQSYGP